MVIIKQIFKKYKRISVAVVEDQMSISNQIRWQILKMFNRTIQVLAVKTLEEAEDLLKLGLAEIWIVDLGLPDGNGEDLIKLVRAQSERIPIIVQTVQSGLEDQLKMLKQYRRLMYLTKDELFNQLAKALFWAYDEVDYDLDYRLSIPNTGFASSVHIHDVCYLMTTTGSNHLHVELYDLVTASYHNDEMRNMNLTKFMEESNKLGIFLRCSQGYVVNIKMIEKVDLLTDEVVLLHRCQRNIKDKKKEEGREIRIPIGPGYKKAVKAATKGLY